MPRRGHAEKRGHAENKDLSARRGRLVLTRRTRSHRWSRTCPRLPTAWRCLRPKPERATLSLMWKTQSRALKISATPSRITRKERCPTSIRRRVDPTQAPATALICRHVALVELHRLDAQQVPETGLVEEYVAQRALGRFRRRVELNGEVAVCGDEHVEDHHG